MYSDYPEEQPLFGWLLRRGNGNDDQAAAARNSPRCLECFEDAAEPLVPNGEVIAERRTCDLLEIVEDRYGVSSTIVTSQREPDQWHAVIGDPTIGDAILDRLVHNAHRLKLGGPSIRKTKNGLTASEPAGKEKN